MKYIIYAFIAILLSSCAKKDDVEALEITETAQQLGDVMASIDEAGKSTGDIASANDLLKKSIEKTFACYAPDNSLELSKKNFIKFIQPKAQAVSCTANGFAGCNTNTMLRSFAGCTVGDAVFDGTVLLSWTGASVNCALQNTNDTITRSPNFTVTGLRGATLSVTNAGVYGQKITLTSSASANPRIFSFSSDGINRKFTLASGNILLNQTTTTAANMTITGGARSGRILNGGLVRVTNNLTSTYCEYMPVAVTWNASCNCPISGTWNGSCSTGQSTSLAITACGAGTYTEGSTVTPVTFDRCGT